MARFGRVRWHSPGRRIGPDGRPEVSLGVVRWHRGRVDSQPGPYDGLLPPPALLAQEGLEVRLELREGLALSLGAVDRVGDVAQDVEAGGLGDGEHLGVLGALELEPRPGGQRPGAAAPEVADRAARRKAEGLDVRRHGSAGKQLRQDVVELLFCECGFEHSVADFLHDGVRSR